jgi:hypothetical protein
MITRIKILYIGFICRDRNVYRFTLSNPTGTKENLGNYVSWCYLCNTVSVNIILTL